ncbi:hypothetical protein SAMN05660831_02077 [Thiohalospira halophila DSM 15071]|uniref:Ribosome modulation factor n=1 Tax=Thiohalospira halophila DSM 15071 TaxID=1123397 RepID=A0A1I1UA08_9GAMM|nr:hypothetical protein [Thiohalospira halophila]SFD67465.1 hypothetical protein SAMN05660831_02077 [Thiohalospira halophila DSM 15071]
MGSRRTSKDASYAGPDPWIAGYWAEVWGCDREPPSHHPESGNPEWRERWLAGYREAESRRGAVRESAHA